MSKKPEEIRKFLTDTFGEFKDFKKEFFRIKFGTLPPNVHPNSNTISKVRKMEEWPYNFRELDKFFAVCYVCKNRGIFSGCKLCAKVVIGACEGLRKELYIEEIREDQKKEADK